MCIRDSSLEFSENLRDWTAIPQERLELLSLDNPDLAEDESSLMVRYSPAPSSKQMFYRLRVRKIPIVDTPDEDAN